MTSRLTMKNPLLFTIAIFSSLFGFSGIEHGFFEILQGNTKPNGFIISAIGPLQRFWLHGTETAFTLIPNFQITGIIAIITSICVIIWSLYFLRNKYSWIILLFLSVAQFLTGGGFAQIFLSVVLSITAAGLYRPRKFWKEYISEKFRLFLSFLWNITFLLFIAIFIISMEMAVFGLPYGKTNPEMIYGVMMSFSYIMIILFCLSLVFAYAKDSMISEKV
jgi:hypothetical protein